MFSNCGLSRKGKVFVSHRAHGSLRGRDRVVARRMMALHVLAYNLKRVMNILGIGPLIAAMRAA